MAKRNFIVAATVLVVEDEVLISASVGEALAENGFSVHCEDTADAALRYLESDQAADLLLTDINLPGDIDGAELAARARKLRPDLPIIYASGQCSPDDLASLVPRSVFVNKPYDLSDVCTLIGRLVLTAH
jgi:two-component system, response regulator PdtaR